MWRGGGDVYKGWGSWDLVPGLGGRGLGGVGEARGGIEREGINYDPCDGTKWCLCMVEITQGLVADGLHRQSNS